MALCFSLKLIKRGEQIEEEKNGGEKELLKVKKWKGKEKGLGGVNESDLNCGLYP